MVAQQRYHRHHGSKARNYRAEGSKQRHKSAAQLSSHSSNAARQVQAAFAKDSLCASTKDVSNGRRRCARRVRCCDHGIHCIGWNVRHIVDVASRSEDFPSNGLHRLFLPARQRIRVQSTDHAACQRTQPPCDTALPGTVRHPCAHLCRFQDIATIAP